MIKSLLDNDQYKFTMQNAVLQLYPDAVAEYVFVNRRKIDKFNQIFVDRLRFEVDKMEELQMSESEYENLPIPWLGPAYMEYIKNYRFNPDEVTISLVDDDLHLSVIGPWHRTILWEVPLMALISELYFETIDRNWDIGGQEDNAKEKACRLTQAGCNFADFGTRRRRSFEIQEIVVKSMIDDVNFPGRFIGTSNVLLAMSNNLTAIGTFAHEWIQAHSILGSLSHANRDAMEAWIKVYNSELGIALTDTYGTDAFLKDFNAYYARLFDGVRHDSGDPKVFADKVIAHYKKLRINPSTKTIVFSDNLNVEKAIDLQKYCLGKIKCAFGIGTHFSNDFGESKALNMVIKMVKLNGTPVVKLSDDVGKQIGDRDALRVARYCCQGTPLDQ